MWPVWLYHIIPHCFINGTTFGKILLIIKCPRRTWIGVQAAMTTRNLEPDHGETARNGVWFPEDGDSCYKTG
jgi:hypothetical protein